MKKLINHPENVVKEELEGVALAHPDLVKVHYDPNYVVRADAPIQGKVGLLSGGGSGMNPCTAASSDGACWTPPAPVQVFTSPTPDQMLEATKADRTAARASCTSSRTTPAIS
jgi:phosphoenolpyruvate---glycerone phosphotransferase subunit DhaK